MAEFSDSLGLQDFQNYCRLCFEPGSKLENLLTSPVERNLGEKIVDCVNVSVRTLWFGLVAGLRW